MKFRLIGLVVALSIPGIFAAAAPPPNAAKVDQFLREYAGGPNFSRCRVFLELANDPENSTAHPGTRIEEITEALAILEKVEAACKGPYQGVSGSVYSADREDRLRKNMDLWCKAASMRQELARRAVRNLALSTFGIIERVIESNRKELGMHEGYLHIDELPVRQALFNREAFLADLATRFAEHFKLVGITDPAELLAPLDKIIVGLNQEIDRLAPRWKFVAPAHDAAIEALARKQVKAEYPKAALRAVGLDDTSWTIVKNRKGLPLERVRHGKVLYKVDGEKWCRQQSFTYTETYAGGGSYTKASGVRLDYLRFLSCP
ncbi:MAG: hypothetical protein KA419_08035 [Acidobacteria bacterium]|nr:hypothetical protein [Acidobacteriota bacterium]